MSRTDLTPPGFWKELASNEEAVSRLVQSVRDNDTASWSELAMSLQAAAVNCGLCLEQTEMCPAGDHVSLVKG